GRRRGTEARRVSSRGRHPPHSTLPSAVRSRTGDAVENPRALPTISLDVTEKSRDRRGAENEKAFRCGRFGVARPTSPPSTKGHSQCGGEERICGGGSMGIWSYGSGARD